VKKSVILAVIITGLALAAITSVRPAPHQLLTESSFVPAAALEETIAGSLEYPVHINAPGGPPRLTTDILDAVGNPVTIACSTCHTIREPNPLNAVTGDLDEFHQGLQLAHAGLACLSCHNANDYDSQRLVSGAAVSYPDVMTLCAQCHGPKFRDYQNGAHGGMAGHWDLTRGPRVRNNCVDCHDAHAPAFPRMQPSFKPVDRFLENPSHAGGEH
jgi:formate-dependent nitrite reductase cytochrome c552 subunit